MGRSKGEWEKGEGRYGRMEGKRERKRRKKFSFGERRRWKERSGKWEKIWMER